jgi:hypothetical protein
MAFDWLETRTSEGVRNRGSELRIAMYAEEVRLRAGLLRRLGYDADYALLRCAGNFAWSHGSAGGSPALTKADLKRLVSEVFAR